MWETSVEHLEAGRIRRVVITRGGSPLRYREVLEGWSDDAGFRAFFSATLAEAPYAAYAWETPPVTAATLDREFEFVLVDDPLLAGERADAGPFRDVFARLDPAVEIATFRNLGGDAWLVAPCPGDPPRAYPHLAAFARDAPPSQQHALWAAVGAALDRRVHDRPTWLSTAGLGVAWLHVRLDSRPKYYRFGPYRSA